MASGTLAPSPRLTMLNSSGHPYSGALLYTVSAGGVWPGNAVATYTDVGLATPNANPVVADSAGRIGPVFLAPGSSYKFIFTTSSGVAIYTQDNIAAVPGSAASLDITGTAGEALTAGQAVYLSDGSGGKVAGQWYKADAANTYSSITPEVGMATASIASGGSGTIRLGGSVAGLTVTTGLTYYVGTAGAITSTAPANRRLLGVADTTSTLVLSADPPPPVFSSGAVGAVSVGVGSTTVGLYSSGTNALDVATNGVKALGIDSTQFIDSPTQPRCSAFRNATQAIANTTETALTFNAEDFDVGALHDTAANTSRITVPTGGDGLYAFYATVAFEANSTGSRMLKFKKNATTDVGSEARISNNGSAATSTFSQCLLIPLVATDFIEAIVWQDSGVSLNVGSATRSLGCQLAAVKLW